MRPIRPKQRGHGWLRFLAYRSFAVNKTILTSVVVAAMVTGCNSSKKAQTSVTDPIAPSPVAYQPTPQPYTAPPVAQPVVYDTTPAQPVANISPAAGGGSYTVKKGDTL